MGQRLLDAFSDRELVFLELRLLPPSLIVFSHVLGETSAGLMVKEQTKTRIEVLSQLSSLLAIDP